MKPVIYYKISPDRKRVRFEIRMKINNQVNLLHYSETTCFVEEFIAIVKHFKDVDFIEEGHNV